MPHPALTDLHALLERVRAGRFEPLGGPHADDAHLAATFRRAAVLALFTPASRSGAAAPGVDLFLVQRSPALRHHPGQIALPGGRIEPGDDGPAGAALRETQEETGIAPDAVAVLGRLPQVLVPVSGFAVVPHLGWAEAVAPTTPSADGEVLHTLRVPVAELLRPAARATVLLAGHRSAGFRVPSGWVWGFTGNLLDHLFTQIGWTLPWDRSVEHAMSWDEARGAQLLGDD
ncbi:CoA pyrophosphatase [Ruania suaedae]|uniref:NUDIX hydrolase n=1 Tax=Ruania suaedae TaxID=2897774 RepID=UPI001E2D685A|nr:CoA pyrophosphatase [Ruania suaedae]UFU03970.1 CoA pyrophosphatase [Ruania suaedae]